MVASVVLYGYENCAFSIGGKRRIKMSEIKFVRKVVDHTLRDEVSNLTV
jgi:hypothetical protein